MSKQLITQYYNKVDKLIQFGGTKKETSVRNEFYNLLSHYGERKNLVLVAELPVRGTKGKDVTPDGTLKNILRLDYGYWESKDESLDIDEEIDKKVKRGYPLNNILFEDSNHAVLFQAGQETMRINMRMPDELDRILTAFINFEKPEVRKFNEALDHFQKDIPTILKTLREKIDSARHENKKFIKSSETFLELCKAEINPDITMADVREMMIQHILTSDIFNKIFDDPEFHQHNSIAKELEQLIGTLFTYSDRKNLLGSIEHYYDAINAAAAGIVDHHEKQKFLKSLYENFYKAYNPKAADRLGVVYTPNEIVDFMIDSTNYLLEKHFKRLLWDKNVDILDPATGTGTFICNIIDKCPPQYLAHKYKHELHANDVAILPYYIANLNIEYTFKQKMNYYEEFKNLCFVDTLDNTDALAYGGKQHDLFGFSSENSRRIVEQNKKKISVVIGNPPYNANQKNENENNKNREYPYIDKRIRSTYIAKSEAQNSTKVFDMYIRFYRWAMDRVNDGVIALITNRSFIDSRMFDGFRKSIMEDFQFCYIVDTKSDVRANPKIAGTTHNIFGIQTGVAIMFLVKNEKKREDCKIEYVSLPDEWRKEVKWEWFR
ncbi:MAG: N-6 DNA methylase, partial [Bacteroidota bacterium]